jgi:hypothetical protein
MRKEIIGVLMLGSAIDTVSLAPADQDGVYKGVRQRQGDGPAWMVDDSRWRVWTTWNFGVQP